MSLAAPRLLIVGGSDDATPVVVASREGALLAHSPTLTEEQARAVAADPAAATVLDTEQLQAEVETSRLHFAQDITADFEATPDGRISSCNPSFLRLFGFASESAAVGSLLTEHFPSPRAGVAFLETLLREGSLQGHLCELSSLDGRRLHVVQNAVVDTDDSGQPARIRGYMEDRTTERSLVEELNRWQRLEAVGRLAGGVAHDFNNLLTIILNYTEHLERALEGPHRDMITEARIAAERAADLTRRLLAFGRRQSLQEKLIDVNDVIRRMLPLVSSLLGGSIELDLLLASGIGAVRGDAGQLERVFMNLIVNAKDAMPAGGRLTLETELVVVDAPYRRAHPWAHAGRYVLISVTDSGTGMPREVLGHLFEPFFTTKPPGVGTGLGLASAHGIVTQHGGMIRAYSEESVGTTIKVYLPVASRSAAAVGPKLTPPIRGGSERVLLAEDEGSVRRALAHALSAHGYSVVEVDSGEAALAAIAADPSISLCIFDVVMPGMGGLRAYEYVRQENTVLPVVLTSGYSGDLPSERFAEDLRAYFVPKPCSPETLLGEVRRALDEVTSDTG